MVGLDCLFAALVLAACGLVVGYLAGERFGWLGCLLGFPLGAAGAFAIIYGALHAYVYLEKGKGRWHPPCHTGSCQGGRRLGEDGDYELEFVDGEAVHRCQCGRDYVMRDGGKRFLERLPDGTLRPYMIHKSFRGWFPDSEEQA